MFPLPADISLLFIAKMKIAYGFVWLMFFGILGTTTARYSRYPPLPDYSDVPGLSDVFVLLLKSKDIVKNFKEDCNKYGGPEAYSDFTENVEEFVTSFTSVVAEVSDRRQRQPPKNAVDFFVDNVCPAYSDLSNSTKSLLQSYRNCLKPKDRDDVDGDGGALFPLLEFACENQARNIRDISDPNNAECTSSAQPVIIDCFNRSRILNYFEDNVVELGINLLTSDLSRDNCEFSNEVSSCVMKPLRKCKNLKVANIAGTAFSIIDKHTTCEKLLKSSGAAGVIDNVFPVTAIMAIVMSLRFA